MTKVKARIRDAEIAGPQNRRGSFGKTIKMMVLGGTGRLRLVLSCCAAVLVLGLSGCGGDSPTAPTPLPTQDPSGNRYPTTSGSIPAQRLTVGGNPVSVDVAPFFTDPDGDTLTYSARVK